MPTPPVTLSLLLFSMTWLNIANGQLLLDSITTDKNSPELIDSLGPIKNLELIDSLEPINSPELIENLELESNATQDSQSPTPEAPKQLTDNEKFQQELESLKALALEGDAEAQFKVGALYTNTQYQEPDFAQAIHWYTLAAEQNHPLAQYNLGHHYLNGIGVSKNIESAVHLWLKAALQDHPLAQFNVGRAYYLGIGLPTDLTQAKYWFEQAAANDESKSIELLKQVKWDELASNEAEPSASREPSANKEPSANREPSAGEKPSVNKEPSTNQATSVIQIIPEEQTTPKKLSITLYTNPEINHYPISMVEDGSQLNVIKQSGEWTIIEYSEGFPVWVHANFITLTGSQALVTSDDINTRAEPKIIHGNIVGQLDKGETVEVLANSGRWYQIIAPSHFQAWVKTSQLSLSTYIENIANSSKVNDNRWLFEQNPKHYTVQLASLKETDDIDEFLNQSKLKGDNNTYQFDSKKAESIWTYFLYGTYKQKADAIKAKLGIVSKGAQVKSFANIQQNRCVNWKKQLPPPTELNTYCVPTQ